MPGNNAVVFRPEDSLTTPAATSDMQDAGIRREFFSDTSRITKKRFEEKSVTLGGIATGAALAVPAGMDTILNTVGLTGEGDLEALLTKVSEPLGEFYHENESGIRAVGDLGFTIFPIVGATKLARVNSFFGRALNQINKSGDMSRFLLSTGKSINSLTARARREQILFARKGQTVFTGDAAPEAIKAATRQANWTTAADIFKEGVAADFGIWLLQGDSKTLFPEEMDTIEQLTLFGGFNAAFSIGGFSVARHVMKKHITDVAGPIAAASPARNPLGLSQEELLTQTFERPGQRYIATSVQSTQANLLRQQLSQTADATERSNIQAQLIVHDNNIKEIVKRMGGDAPIKGLNKKVTLDDGEVETATKVLQQDESTFINVVSIDHFDAETAGKQYGSRLQKLTEETNTELVAAVLKKSTGGIKNLKEAKDLDTKIVDLQQKQNLINNTTVMVLEPNGGLVPAATRKPIFQDQSGWFTKKHIRTTPATETVNKTYKLKVKGFAGNERKVGVTDTLNILIPDAESGKQMLAGFDAVTVMPSVASAKSAADFKLTLVDIGEDWHFKTGTRGKHIYSNFPAEVRQEIDNWTGDSGSSQLRKWQEAGDPKFQQIIHAYSSAGLHQRLREVSNPDGTITLYRGEKIAERKNPTNDLVSMTGDPAIASAFGRGSDRHTLTMRVPIEDVVMVVGGAGREIEYIIKGNKSRRLGEGVIRQDSFEALDLAERTGVFAGLQKSIANYVPNTTEKVNIFAGDHWARLDAVGEIAARTDANIEEFVTLPSAMEMDLEINAFAAQVDKVGLAKGTRFKTLEDLEFASLREKYFEFVRLNELVKVGQQTGGGLLKIPADQQLNIHDVVRMLNLPEDEAGGLSPIVRLFQDTITQTDIKNPQFDTVYKNLSDVKEAMVRLVAPKRLGEQLSPNIKFRGNMMNRPPEQKSIALSYVNRPEGYIDRGELIEAGLAQRDLMITSLLKADENLAPLVGKILGVHAANPHAWQQSNKVAALAEGSQFGQGIVTTSGFANRDNPIKQAVDMLGDLSDKEVRQYVERMIEPHRPVFNQILARKNQGDLLNLRLVVNAKNEGWDLADTAALATENRQFQLLLDETDANKARWMEKFGVEMPSNAVLPAPITKKTQQNPGMALNISELAMASLTSLAAIDKDILNHINFLRKSQKKGPINYKPWHTPPEDLSGKTLAFLADDTGRVVRVVPGNNASETARLADKEIASIKSTTKQQLHRITEDDMARYFDTLNEVFGRPVNFANPRLQTGKIGGKRAAETVEIGEGFVTNMIEAQIRQYDSIFKETRALIYEPELNMAKQNKRASGILDKETKQARETIWDDYANRVYQKGKLNADSTIGRAYFWAEDTYDKMLSKLFEKKVEILEAGKFQTQFGTQEQKGAYKSLENTLGEFNPFTDMDEFITRTTSIPTPPSLRRHMATLNKITGFLALRIMDAGMAVINLTSLAATIPPVVKTMQRGKLESVEDFANRTAAYGFKATPDVAMWSPTRAAISGVHFMWSKEGAMKVGEDGMNLWQRAASRGLLQQEIAERMAVLTAPTQGYVTRQVENAAETLSWLTDKSETLSRGIAFMTGYNFAKNGLKLADEEAMFFAHNFGNKVIADFRPNNRPQMFQGAAGMPLGLFTTFMWNFMQRIASNVESRQYGALMTQAGTQFALFGANSLPGWDGFVKTFTDNYDGSVNFNDGFAARYGDDALETFNNGIISTVPKLFGADTGIAVMSRAQIATPLTAGPLAGSVPAWTMVSKLGNIVRETAENIQTNGGLNTSQMAETLARYSLTRSFGNSIELYQGYSTDKRGQVMTADTHTGMEIASRLTGFKSTRETAIAREFGRMRNTEFRQQDVRRQLRDSVRATARDTGISKPERERRMRQSFDRYMRANGDPADFGNFLAEQAVIGQTEKVQLEALEAAKNSRRAGEAVRLFELLLPDRSGTMDDRVTKMHTPIEGQ